MIERFDDRGDRSQDLGVVTSVDQPIGVSWVNFHDLALTDYGRYKPDEGQEYRSEIPAGTGELSGIKGEPVQEGDWFWGDVNRDATSQADVDPLFTEFSPNDDPDDGEALDIPEGLEDDGVWNALWEDLDD